MLELAQGRRIGAAIEGPSATAGAEDLRRHERVPTRGRTVWLEWWDGPTAVGVRAELVNIARGGALALAPFAPGPGTAVAFALDGPGPARRVVGRLVAADAGRSGCRLHLEFPGGCPEAIFAAAISDLG